MNFTDFNQLTDLFEFLRNLKPLISFVFATIPEIIQWIKKKIREIRSS